MAKPDKIFSEKLHALEQIVTDSTTAVSDIERAMLREILREFVPDFDYVDGVIETTEKNYLQANKIDAITAEYQQRYADVISRMSDLMITAKNKTIEYYNSLGLDRNITSELGDQIDSMLKSVGIGERGEVIKGSYLSKVSDMDAVTQKVKEYTINQINGKASLKEFSKGFEELLTTTEGVNGLMMRYTTQFTHDILFNLQRTIDRSLAVAHDIRYYYFQGTEIKSSRPFCKGGEDKNGIDYKSKIGQVFTEDEVKAWATEKAWQGKQKAPDTYDPFVNVGGYNCRHILRPVTIEFAKRFRKDLK